MVEVFKTNVTESFHAEILLRLIHTSFKDCCASFDLEDCDKILRIECSNTFKSDHLIGLLKDMGFKIEILSDEIPSAFISNIGIYESA